MAIIPNPHKTTGFLGWIDDRFPLTKLWKDHLSEYYAPKNFNFFYYFGSLALLVLVNQLLTGIFLTMNYKPGADTAFDSHQIKIGRKLAVKLLNASKLIDFPFHISL